MSLGRKLRELRERVGLSQAEVAKRLGVTRNAISQWESDTNRSSTKHLRHLAALYGVAKETFDDPVDDKSAQILETAHRLFERVGFEETSVPTLCAAANVTEFEFSSAFSSKEALLAAVAERHRETILSELRRLPPRYGSLGARLKQFFHLRAVHDLAGLNIVAPDQAQSWRWGEGDERRSARQFSEFSDVVLQLFDEAAAQGQIKQANFRAATQLLFAAYTGILRKARYSRFAADELVAQLDPQLAIVLAGLAYTAPPGFAEDQPTA